MLPVTFWWGKWSGCITKFYDDFDMQSKLALRETIQKEVVWKVMYVSVVEELRGRPYLSFHNCSLNQVIFNILWRTNISMILTNRCSLMFHDISTVTKGSVKPFFYFHAYITFNLQGYLRISCRFIFMCLSVKVSVQFLLHFCVFSKINAYCCSCTSYKTFLNSFGCHTRMTPICVRHPFSTARVR